MSWKSGMINMNGYQPKKVDVDISKAPKSWTECKTPEYEYKVAWANERNKAYIEYLLNNGWSFYNAQIPLIYFRKEKQE